MMPTLTADSVTLHYQPFATCGGRTVGLEALMRWHHRQRGAISPEAFIPIFANSGLSATLSRWALTEACTAASAWIRPLTVAVNISTHQFNQTDLSVDIPAVLAGSGLSVDRLELDMTAAVLEADPSRAGSILGRLRDLGVGIALDDFGAGESRPTTLLQFPFSKVKIDYAVVAQIEVSESARSIVRMILGLAQSRNLCVAAEGIETRAQLAFLRDEGCDIAQGCLIGPPAPLETFATLVGMPEEARQVSATPAAATPWREPREMTMARLHEVSI